MIGIATGASNASWRYVLQIGAFTCVFASLNLARLMNVAVTGMPSLPGDISVVTSYSLAR